MPNNWVHIIFQDYAIGHGITAGKPAATAAVTLLIREGHASDFKRGLLQEVWNLVQGATRSPDDEIVIGIQEVVASQAI